MDCREPDATCKHESWCVFVGTLGGYFEGHTDLQLTHISHSAIAVVPLISLLTKSPLALQVSCSLKRQGFVLLLRNLD